MTIKLPTRRRADEISDRADRARRQARERLDAAQSRISEVQSTLAETAADVAELAKRVEDVTPPEEVIAAAKTAKGRVASWRPSLPDFGRIVRGAKLPAMPELPAVAELQERVELPEMPDLSAVRRRLGLRTARERRTSAWLGTGRNLVVVVGAAVLGALTIYLFDPDRGRSRRAKALDQAAGLARKAGRRAGRAARYGMSTAAAVGERMTRQTRSYVPPNDATLQAKVESELFRDPTIPKGRLNINVENGVVMLRGVAETPEQIGQIVAATRAIAGVRDVHSLLHLPDAPAPDEMVGPGMTSA